MWTVCRKRNNRTACLIDGNHLTVPLPGQVSHTAFSVPPLESLGRLSQKAFDRPVVF